MLPTKRARLFIIEDLDRRILLHHAGADVLLRYQYSLSAPVAELAPVAVGKYALFAGGLGNSFALSDAVEIFDSSIDPLRASPWSTATLSSSGFFAAAAAGDVALFAKPGQTHTTVDEFDADTAAWTTLTAPLPIVSTAAASVGDEAVFLDSVGCEIYNGANGEWSMSPANQITANIAATLGDRVYFAGNGDMVDVYDATTNSVSNITIPNLGSNPIVTSVTTLGQDVMFMTDSDGVAVYDTITGRWSSHQLSQVRGEVVATRVGQEVLFAGGHSAVPQPTEAVGDSAVVDVFDGTSKVWSVLSLGTARHSASAVAVGDDAVIAGGELDGLGDIDGGSDAADVLADSIPEANLEGSLYGRSGGRATVALDNTGDAGFTGPITVQVYAVPPGQYHRAVLVGSQAVNGSLAAGASVRLSVPIAIASEAPAGTYHLVAMVKASDGTLTPFAGATENFTVGKSNSSNKNSSLPIHPTLSVAPTPPTTPDPWQTWLASGDNVLD